MEHLYVKKIKEHTKHTDKHIVDFVSRVSMVRKRLIAFSYDLCPKIVAASKILSKTTHFSKPFLILRVSVTCEVILIQLQHQCYIMR